jgi:PAS domain S-box-containing protein
MSTTHETLIVRNCRRFSAASAWASIAAAIAVMTGWWLHIATLTSIVPGLVTMKPNTALCILLAGIALLILRVPVNDPAQQKSASIWVARICALTIVVIGLVSFIERLSGRDLGIDLLFFRNTLIGTGVPHPGLMAMAASVVFFVLGAALLALDVETSGNRYPAQGLALGVVLVGFVSLLGYVYGVERLFGAAGYSVVAVNTAVTFVLLGTGILCARPEKGVMAVLTSNRLGGLMARRLMPAFFALPLLVGWLRLRGQNAGLYRPEFGAALFTGAYIVFLEILIWSCALWLNRADVARRRVEERDLELAAIVESSSEAFVGKTLDGTITSWNRGAQQLYGYSEEEMLGKNISLLVPAGHIEDVSLFFAELRKGFPIENFETVRRRKDKVLIHVSLTISPVQDREGTVIGASSVSRDITARKLAEDRLSQSRAQLKGIIDSAMDAVITVDQEQRVLMFNAAAEKMFDYSAEQIVGSPLERLIPQRLRPVHADHIRIFSQTGTTSRAMGALGALSGLRRDGNEFPIEASISQVEIGGKKFFTAIVRDVTDRQRAEESLRQSQAQLQGIINSAMDALITVDSKQRVVMFNLAAEKMFGCSAADALGSPLDRFIPERFRAAHSSHVKNFGETGVTSRAMGTLGALKGLRANGEEFPIEASISQIEKNGNKLFTAILRDVTGRVRADRALHEAQEQLRLFVEHAPAAIAMLDREMKYIAASNRWLTDYDVKDATIIGRSYYDVFPDLPEQRRDIHRRCLEGAVESSDAERWVRADGKAEWLRWEARPWRKSDNAIGGLIIFSELITERKKMEEHLMHSQKMEALGTLTGGIAHDFNNILLAIGGNARLAIEELPPDHPLQHSLHEIAKAGTRASNLVRQILAFSRRQMPDRKVTAVQPVVEEALRLLHATLPARIGIRSSFAADLPNISADSTQLHQVIMNLGTNGARAMGEAGGVLEVTVKACSLLSDRTDGLAQLHDGEYVRISVSDSGCGMDPAIVERIFDPFFTTQAPGHGTGLGLSVVHGIMKDHDGAITVYSEPGKGTIFHLYFRSAVERADQSAQPATPVRGKGEHLLYVDDEEALVLLARRSLGRLGYQVTGHTNPAEALQAFAEHPENFAAVITDLSMPGMSGVELARQILQIRPDVPIVMTSGYIRPEDELEAQKIGVRELLLKPDTIDDLAVALQRVLAGGDVNARGQLAD